MLSKRDSSKGHHWDQQVTPAPTTTSRIPVEDLVSDLKLNQRSRNDTPGIAQARYNFQRLISWSQPNFPTPYVHAQWLEWASEVVNRMRHANATIASLDAMLRERRRTIDTLSRETRAKGSEILDLSKARRNQGDTIKKYQDAVRKYVLKYNDMLTRLARAGTRIARLQRVRDNLRDTNRKQADRIELLEGQVDYWHDEFLKESEAADAQQGRIKSIEAAYVSAADMLSAEQAKSGSLGVSVENQRSTILQLMATNDKLAAEVKRLKAVQAGETARAERMRVAYTGANDKVNALRRNYTAVSDMLAGEQARSARLVKDITLVKEAASNEAAEVDRLRKVTAIATERMGDARQALRDGSMDAWQRGELALRLLK